MGCSADSGDGVEGHFCCGVESGPIRERFEELYNKKEFENIVNFSDVKKGDLYVNLIQYDKNMKNEKNMEYYRYFSIKIIGNYYPFDDFDMLKLFLSKLKQIPLLLLIF